MAAWDRQWEEVFSSRDWGKYPAETVVRFIAKNYYDRDRRKTRILEIGCGPGANIWYMAREGFDVYGVDGSKTAIRKAAETLAADGLAAALSCGDIEKLGYPDDYFDAVIDNECLYCNTSESAKGMMGEIARVMKQDGLFYSRTFTDETYIGEDFNKTHDDEYIRVNDGPLKKMGYARVTSRQAIEDLYGKYFRILSVDKIEETRENGKIRVSEWIIISRKKGT